MLEDFINWSPEKCKQLIHIYQETRDKELFSLLLARYDMYLVKLMHEFYDNYSFLSEETPLDIYQAAIVGFHKFLLKYKQKTNVGSILPGIKAYVKRELIIEYGQKRKEGKKEEISDAIMNGDVHIQFEKFRDNLSAHIISNSPMLTDREKKLLEMRYFQDLTLEQIAKKKHTTLYNIYNGLQQCLRKLRNRVKYFHL